MRRDAIFAFALCCASGSLGCEDPPAQSKGGGPTKAATPPPAPAIAEDKKKADDLRRKQVKDEDFVESDVNRDPFRAFVIETRGEPTGPKARQYPVLFEKFGCEEIKLIAVIGGDLNPLAMFRDPTGVGQTVKVSDHICSSDLKVVRIVPDGVIVESTEDMGGGKPRTVQRKIAMNTEEGTQ